jgi:hypothetical protein
MRKDYRQNYRAGTNPFGRKSNLQRIAETFGPKKKVKKNKKPTKRMFANKGGGADTGTMGELKSKLAVLSDRMRKIKIPEKLTDEDKKRINDLLKKQMGGGSPFINAVQKIMREREPGNTRFSNTDIQLAKDALKRGIKPSEMKKGGLAKKKKKFPDMSGDGKVTMKDVLMARGVIPKKKKTKKKVI